MRRFLLVDGNNLFMRGFHAMRELRVRSGGRTGGVLGVLKGISWCRHRTGIPLHDVVVFWDGGRSDTRMALLPTYKLRAGRDPDDADSIYEQLGWSKECLSNVELRQVCVGGVEADDLISIFASLLQSEGMGSIIFSGDGDFHALYTSFIKIYDPKKEILGLGDILNKWGVNDVQQVTLAKALAGDASDKIKGLTQVGPKRAAMLCSFLTWERSRRGHMRFKRNSREPETDVQKNLLERVMSKEGVKTVERNLELIHLPRKFEHSFLTEEQQEDAMLQWLEPRKRSTRKFISWLEKLEFDSILKNLSNW